MNSPASDVIEFQCVHCSKVLRVPVAAAGKKAKCPGCANIQEVPPEPSNNVAAPISGVDNPSADPIISAPTGESIFDSDVMSGSGISITSPASPTPSPPVAPPVAPAVSELTTPVSPVSSADKMTSHHTSQESNTPTRELFKKITSEISKIYVGQEEMVLGTLVALFSSGHVLIESPPGLGKTLFVRALGRVLGCDFGRVQFTADLMPSDITGAPIFDMKSNEFRFRKGPIFTQLLLADEINRAPAKTHAALLEIMQEFHVTVDGTTHEIERPFLVMATQNPIESEGTYNLPEAQLDRFMFKLNLDYPAVEEEAEILRDHSRQLDINKRLEEELDVICSPQQILEVTLANGKVIVDDKLIDYINKIVRLTREWPQFHMGASPRAGLTLMQGARTLAAFSGRDYAVPDDVVQIALPALRHRVILSAEAEVEGHHVDELLTELIRTVEVPRL